MIYVDTSVLVALLLKEPRSSEVARWHAACEDELVSASWCVTEFASALSIKQRTGQIDGTEAQAAWQRFERLCANDMQLMPVEPVTFHRAAIMALDPTPDSAPATRCILPRHSTPRRRVWRRWMRFWQRMPKR
jgi:predicted nucleic acid-binding protein